MLKASAQRELGRLKGLGTLEECIKGVWSCSGLQCSRLSMASDNCAVGPDGELLDKSQIPWVNDPDDDEPMAPATTSLVVQCQLRVSATTLDSFVSKVPPATC